MNGTRAICGHYVPAVGFVGSHARRICESSLCPHCEEVKREAVKAALREIDNFFHESKAGPLGDPLAVKLDKAIEEAIVLHFGAKKIPELFGERS